MLCALALLASGCLHRPTDNPNVIVVGVTSGPNNLDPRIGTDDVSGKISQLVFNNLMTLDEHLQVVPDLAERLDHPDPTTWVATLRRGVRFHDGHELTSADVVYTFRSLLDPKLLSPRKGAYRMVQAVDARDRDTVVFTLKEPFGSFPAQLVLPIVPDGAGPAFREHPVGTGPYRFVKNVVDDRVELETFKEYFGGRPANDGVVLRVVPDDIMRGLELRKGTIDVVINDLAPDIVYQLGQDPRLQLVKSAGTDYQYIGVNLRDPILQDVRVRQAIAYAIDRDAIITHLRRGLAIPAAGMLPPMSWAFEPGVATYAYDPAKARVLLDEAGHPAVDGVRFRLTLKVSNLEFNRLQSSVIQQNLRDVGIALDIRTYEFATFYADVLKGNFQVFTLQWVGGAVADPDILRRVFHSAQVPPNGFNRGFFHDAYIDQVLDRAAAQDDVRMARAMYSDVQRRVALDVPYISLWCKTNVIVAQRTLTGFTLLPTLDFIFLKNVARTPADQRAAR
ncbi:MAG: ABC transporter substrate-binding protein [Acidobacteria bacterium]|nr:ABC transporter substrate-binding protein [Acidobacteriota bacterium]